MRAGSSLCVDDRSFVNITSMTKTLKTPSFTFYHKTATKIITLKVCRYTDIRGPPGEQQHALCHVLKSKTSSKHCLSLGSAALWKPLIAKLLRCLRVSFWDSLVCCLPTSIPSSLPVFHGLFWSWSGVSVQPWIITAAFGFSRQFHGAFPIWAQQAACDLTHNNGFFGALVSFLGMLQMPLDSTKLRQWVISSRCKEKLLMALSSWSLLKAVGSWCAPGSASLDPLQPPEH